jgi:ABC-type transporter Mla MlaB component
MSEIPEVKRKRSRSTRKAVAGDGVVDVAAAAIASDFAHRVELPADLGIENVAVLREQLEAVLEDERPVELAGAGVQRLHTAGLQLLALFCRERQEHGRAVVWHEPVPMLAGAARLLGLGPVLKVPEPAG